MKIVDQNTEITINKGRRGDYFLEFIPEGKETIFICLTPLALHRVSLALKSVKRGIPVNGFNRRSMWVECNQIMVSRPEKSGGIIHQYMLTPQESADLRTWIESML